MLSLNPHRITAKNMSSPFIHGQLFVYVEVSVVRPEDVQDFVFPLDVSKIPGIGQKTTEALKLMGITKVEELANCDIQRLTERFGKMGLWLKQAAYGLDFSEIEESEEAVKSISRSSTFKENTNDPIK